MPLPPETMEEINKILSEIPAENLIPWPEELKEIIANNCEENECKQCLEGIECKTAYYGQCREQCKYCSIYKLPCIPLDKLSWSKKEPIELPGLQLPSLSVSLSLLGNYAGFEAKSPSGGNPYSIDEIKSNLEQIKDTLNNKIIPACDNVIEVLE